MIKNTNAHAQRQKAQRFLTEIRHMSNTLSVSVPLKVNTSNLFILMVCYVFFEQAYLQSVMHDLFL